MAYMPKNGGQDEENSEQRDEMEVGYGAQAVVCFLSLRAYLIFYFTTL